MATRKPPPEAFFQDPAAPAYAGPERRNHDQIYQMLKDQGEKIDAIQKTLMSAFPGGDHDGHRRYHELVIKREERRERLHQAIIEKSLASLVWAMLVTAALAIWNYMRDHVAR